MQTNFNKYLGTLGAIVTTGLILVGAGCTGSAPTATAPITPSVAVGEPSPSTEPTTPVAPPVETPVEAKPVVTANIYKDGTYTATGEYVSPAGPETITITLTLKDDVITGADAVSNATNPKSISYQGKFISGYKALIIGKKIDEVQLTVVSGSSLTPKGFMEALAEIKTQAKV